MHTPPLIQDLAVILATAGIVTFLFRKIRQPVVLGYVIAGILIGPHTPPHSLVTDLPSIQTWSELGVIFLMFALGLEFSFHKLTRVGMPATGTALIEVISMLGMGYLCGQILGWSGTDSIFLGGILSVSSTTIIIKALEELKLKNRRFAEIVFGVLIVEDLVAILLLVALSTVAVTQSFFSWELVQAAGKLLFVVGSWFVVGYFLIPSFLRYAGRDMDDDTITVFACGLCLLLVVVATHFHYSAALGAFIMGSILAESHEVHRIEHLIRPLKSVFAAVFFVSVGMLVDPRVILTHWPAIALITAATVFGKLLTSTLGALVSGQKPVPAIQIGFSLAQIGEFSFIIAGLGMSLGVTSDFLYPIAVAVSAITTFTTPYLIGWSGPVGNWVEAHLPARVRRGLDHYSAALQSTTESQAARKRVVNQVLRYSVNGIAATLAFLLMGRFALPALGPWLAWAAAVILAAPFFWGMLTAFRGGQGTIFLRLIGATATIVWAGILSDQFFDTTLATLITVVLILTVFSLFYRRLESSYRWFESRFISNFSDRQKGEEPALKNLAPWDLHLVRMAVHPNAKLAGRPLKAIDVRNRFGLNIVVIQRGRQNIVPPKADDMLFPGDGLLVLGTDAQIEAFQKQIGEAEGAPTVNQALTQFSLRRLAMTAESELLGKTIRDSGIRDRLHSIVVGMERGEKRMLNPDPALTLEKGDVLWLVGTAA